MLARAAQRHSVKNGLRLLNLAAFSTGKRQLYRDFIGNSLYHPESGYFNITKCIYTPTRINFKQLVGQQQYQTKLAELFKVSSWFVFAFAQLVVQATPEGWLTPVEIFQPFYAWAVLKWMLRAHCPEVTMRAEGVGTLASMHGSRPAHPHHAHRLEPDQMLAMQTGNKRAPLRIIEVGGGSGTCARSAAAALR